MTHSSAFFVVAVLTSAPSTAWFSCPSIRWRCPPEQRAAAIENCGHDESQPLTVLLKDDTECIRCGLCAQRCPTEAMTMERFHFAEKSS